jgi:hypothetical protein
MRAVSTERNKLAFTDLSPSLIFSIKSMLPSYFIFTN